MGDDGLPLAATMARRVRPASATVGAVLGDRYRFERLIGTGGMSEVWEARHLMLDRLVAVKLLTPELRSEAARLVREARALARIRHRSIVEVYDCGLVADGAPFLVMERLYGRTLGAAIAMAPLTQAAAVRLLLPVLDGLAAAHASGVIHRDLKPDNIFLVDDGAGGATPRVLDFGIATVGEDADVRQTAVCMGTPPYMAPEQFRGEQVDERTDVWGVSATLYEMLVGTPPFGDDNPPAIMDRVINGPVPFPRGVAQLDGKLWGILTRGLRKVPEQRFASAAAMRDELSGWLMTRSGPTTLPPAAPAAVAPVAPEPPNHQTASATLRARSSGGQATPGTFDDVIRQKLTPKGKT